MIPGLGSSGSLGRDLPAVDRAALPPEVRRGSAEDQQAYRAALGFERMLVKQLVQSMNRAGEAAGGGEEDEGTFAGSNAAYRDLLTDSLADNVIRGGGLGLAEDLYRTLRPQAR